MSSATKLEEKDTTLAHKLELQERLPTLYCPPIRYRSNSKPCAVRHFDVLVPVSAVRRRGYTTISMLSHILNESDPPVLGDSNKTRHVTNKSSESGGKYE